MLLDLRSSSPDAMLETLAAFPVPSTELLARRELLRRVDIKYVLELAALERFLAEIGSDYAVLRAGQQTIATYRNLYFDTPDLRCFHDHRRGRRIRRKVRIRHYPDREVSFLEVKLKRSELVTEKRRRKIAFGCETLDDDDRAFLAEQAPGLDLAPTLRVDYRRISLLHLSTEERLTIDLELAASQGDGLPNSVRCAFGAFAIVELKRRAGTHVSTAAVRALWHHRERSLSKYCAATALLYPTIRHNRLRPDLRGLA